MTFSQKCGNAGNKPKCGISCTIAGRLTPMRYCTASIRYEYIRSLRCRVGCSSHVSQLSLLGPGRLLSALDRWGQYLLRHEAETLCLGVDKPIHTSAGAKLGYDVIADEIPTRQARASP